MSEDRPGALARPEVPRARPDTAPRRITITLEAAQEKLIPVEAVVTDALPRGFEIQGGSPQLETSQVLVSGPQSLVEQVTAARVVLNLSQRRNPFTDELRLLAVNVVVGGLIAVTAMRGLYWLRKAAIRVSGSTLPVL